MGHSECPFIRHGTTGQGVPPNLDPRMIVVIAPGLFISFSPFAFSMVRRWGQTPESLSEQPPPFPCLHDAARTGFPAPPPAPRVPVAQLGQHLKQGFTRAAASHENGQSGPRHRAKTTGVVVKQWAEFHRSPPASSPHQPRRCTASSAQRRTPTSVRPNALRKVSCSHRFSSASR